MHSSVASASPICISPLSSLSPETTNKLLGVIVVLVVFISTLVLVKVIVAPSSVILLSPKVSVSGVHFGMVFKVIVLL